MKYFQMISLIYIFFFLFLHFKMVIFVRFIWVMGNLKRDL